MNSLITIPFTARARARISVMARTTNVQGATQIFELIVNASGYHNNVVQKIALDIS